MKINFLSDTTCSKNNATKKSILRNLISGGNNTIAELGNCLGLSIPTTTKFISELVEDGFVVDFGKQNTHGGRKPNAFGLNPDAGYFIGVDVRHDRIDLGIIDFNGKDITNIVHIPKSLVDSVEMVDFICDSVSDYVNALTIDKDKIISVGVNLTGRVNPVTGESYTYFEFYDRPLAQELTDRIGYYTTIDNDTKAMTYAEQVQGVIEDESNVLYINFDWGIGLGIIIDKRLYYGKSGLSGEIGHHLTFDNDKLCYCGKRGCLETEISGHALYRKLRECHKAGASTSLKDKLNDDDVQLIDIINTILKEDMLAIELLEKMANDLGRYVAGLINIFNPELIVLGGCVSMADQYLSLPLTTAIKKNSLNLVNKDTVIKVSTLGKNAGVIGACMITRSRMLGIL